MGKLKERGQLLIEVEEGEGMRPLIFNKLVLIYEDYEGNRNSFAFKTTQEFLKWAEERLKKYH